MLMHYRKESHGAGSSANRLFFINIDDTAETILRTTNIDNNQQHDSFATGKNALFQLVASVCGIETLLETTY